MRDGNTDKVDEHRHHRSNKEKAATERRKQQAVDGLLLGWLGSRSMIFQSLVSRVFVSAADHSWCFRIGDGLASFLRSKYEVVSTNFFAS